jgi:nitroreductase
MTAEPLSQEEISSLFEAARYAPSAYNGQPWRFIYATPNDPSWQDFFHLLVQFNQSWCKNASMLVIICSRKDHEHNNKPSRTHSFDTGAAWMAMALEGSRRGLVVHGLEGFSYEKAYTVARVPSDFQIEAMVAVGKRAAKEALAAPLQEKETPSKRRPLSEILFHQAMS